VTKGTDGTCGHTNIFNSVKRNNLMILIVQIVGIIYD